MEKLTSWDFWKAALARAIWTIAQTMLAMLTIGMTVQEVDWMNLLSVGAVAGVYSLLKSIVAGLPEMDKMDVYLIPDTEQAQEQDPADKEEK